MIVAHISDLHVRAEGRLAYRVIDTAPFLERAVATLNRLRPQPDLIIATGDLVDAGAPDEYARLAELLAPLHAPLFPVAGNHDDRVALRATFSADGLLRTGDAPVQYTIEGADVRVVVVDSTEPGREGGAFDAARLAWLDERLAEDARPTIVAMHHPPFSTGIPGMDALGFLELDAFGAVVARHPHVARILCGHIHRTMTVERFGTVITSAPSVAHQLTLDFTPGDATFSLEPPGLLLHRFSDQGLVTHLVAIGDYPGPYAFREPDGSLIAER